MLRAEVLTFGNSPRGPQRFLPTALAVMQAVMLLLLLTVCGNTANLVLARASARQREMGVRLALGSGPARLIRLLLAETMLLGIMGAALGCVFAWWGANALKVIPLTGLPIKMQTYVDGGGLAGQIGNSGHDGVAPLAGVGVISGSGGWPGTSPASSAPAAPPGT